MKPLLTIFALILFFLNTNAQNTSDECSKEPNLKKVSIKKDRTKLKMIKSLPVLKDGEEVAIHQNSLKSTLNSKITNESVNRIVVGTSAHQRPFRREEPKLVSYNADLDVISVTVLLDPNTYAGVNNAGTVGQFYSTDHGQTWEGPVILANDVSEGNNYYISGTMFNPAGNTNIDEVVGVYQGTVFPNTGDWRFKMFGTSKWSGINQQNYMFEETDPDYPMNGYWNYSALQQFGNQIRCMNPKPMGEWVEFSDIDLEIIFGEYNNGSFNWSNSVLLNYDLYFISEEETVAWLGNWMGNDSGSKMVWSKDGSIGYVWIVGVADNAPSGYQPLLYKTTNSGASWYEIELDFMTTEMQNYLESYLISTYNGLYIPYFKETVGAVNKDGDLEIVASLGSHSADVIDHRDSLNYNYDYNYITPGDLFNITIDDNGVEDINYISSFNTKNVEPNDDGSYCGSGWQHRLYASKSPDEKQIMFTWTDTQDGDINEMNTQPDIYGWAKYSYNGTVITSESPVCFTEGTLYEGFYYFTSAADFAYINEDNSYTIPYIQAITPDEFLANSTASTDPVTVNYVTGIEFENLSGEVIANTTVSVLPNFQTVPGDEIFETTIEISDITNLGSFELNLDFDANYLQANSVTLGSFLGSTGRQVFPLTNDIDNTNGLIEYAVTTLGSSLPGPNGDGILLNIEWTSLNVDEDVNTDLILQNIQMTEPDGTLIPVSIENASITINSCYSRDFDCDCDVDIVDVTMAAYTYGSSLGNPNYNASYDLDDDGDIDIVDITMVTYDYGWECEGKSVSGISFNETSNQNVSLKQQEKAISQTEKELVVSVKDIYQLGAYELSYAFDPNNIEILSIEESDFLKNTGRETLEIKKEINQEAGLLNIAITSLGSYIDGAKGDGEILRIKYLKNAPFNHSDFELKNGQLARIDANVIPYKSSYIKENKWEKAFNIYPNPNNGDFLINYQIEETGKYAFVLYAISGEKFILMDEQKLEMGNYILNQSKTELPSGMYLLKLEKSGKTIQSEKLVIRQ